MRLFRHQLEANIRCRANPEQCHQHWIKCWHCPLEDGLPDEHYAENEIPNEHLEP